jgi:glycosyltransferase involved in cell wall biosynthesis
VTCSLLSIGPLPSRNEISRVKQEGFALNCFEGPLEWTAASKDDLCSSAQAIKSLAQTLRVNSIHLHSPAFAAFNLDLPTVAVNHSCVKTWWRAMRHKPIPPDLNWRGDLIRNGMFSCNRIVAPSKHYADLIRDAYNLRESPSVIYNGVTSQAQSKMAMPGSFIFSAGRLWDEAKNFAALDVVASLIEDLIHVAGPLTSPMNDSLAFAYLHHIGVLDSFEMRAVLARRPIFIAPARFEPFGLTVLEAASHGCPLVLNDIPTLRELWDGAASFVDMGNPCRVALTLQSLRGDLKRCEDLGAKAYERSKRYSMEACAKAVMELHRELQYEVVS